MDCNWTLLLVNLLCQAEQIYVEERIIFKRWGKEPGWSFCQFFFCRNIRLISLLIVKSSMPIIWQTYLFSLSFHSDVSNLRFFGTTMPDWENFWTSLLNFTSQPSSLSNFWVYYYNSKDWEWITASTSAGWFGFCFFVRLIAHSP